MKYLKRRATAAVLTLTLLLAATAVCAAIRQSRPKAMAAQSEQLIREAEDPLSEYRTHREQLLQRQRAELNDIIHDSGADSAIVSQARQRLLSLQEDEMNALQIESTLKARGFGDSIAMTGGGAVTILLRSEALTRQQSALILELVLRQTGVTGGNVKIIPIK